MNQKLTPQELAALKSAKTNDEWNKAVNSMLAAHGGCYPPDWYEQAIATNLAEQVLGDAGRMRGTTLECSP